MNKFRVVVYVICLAIAACNGTNIRLKANSLETAIDEYSAAWRWALYNNIAAMHQDRDGGEINLDAERLKTLRVTGYRVAEKIINEAATEATVKGEIEYYNTTQGTLQKVSFEQLWWYDEARKSWFNAGRIPEFK
jgi:hypothetical protein